MAKRKVESQMTIKSQESTWFLRVQVACDIPLESSKWGLQLCFKPHLNQRFSRKVMGPQSRGSPSVGIRDSHLGVRGQNDVWVLVLWAGTKYTIKGKVVVSPKFKLWWVLWIWICSWLVLTLKMFQLYTNQIVIWFCASSCEWVIACHSS
jgi:hypothetical protein